MANLVGRIKDSLPDGCIASGRLRKEGCSVSLKNAPTPSVTIDMDKRQAPVGGNETKCDYIFIGGCDDVYLVPLELKRGKLDASDVVKQLQAGANIADLIISRREQVQFLPVAVCGRFHRADRNRLSKSSSNIRFKGKQFNVSILRCDQPLVDILPRER